jgi:hypothetical protein
MIYIIYFFLIEYKALPTENNSVFEVKGAKVYKEMMFTRRDEAEVNFAKTKALAPYNGWQDVKLDSFTICKPPAKVETIKP